MKERSDKNGHPLSGSSDYSFSSLFLSATCDFVTAPLVTFKTVRFWWPLLKHISSKAGKAILSLLITVLYSLQISENSPTPGMRIICDWFYMGGKLLKVRSASAVAVEVISDNLFHYLAIYFHVLILVSEQIIIGVQRAGLWSLKFNEKK